MLRHSRFLLSLLAALLLPSSATATIHDGSISGTVADSSDRPIPAASVTLFLRGTSRNVAADPVGRFLFTNVPPGHYSIQAEADGFETVVRAAVPVSPASGTDVDFVLAPEPDQTVTLTDETPLLDSAIDAEGSTFTRAALNEVPRWLTYAALVDDVPGVVGVSTGPREQSAYLSRGISGLESRWYIDSFDVTTSDPRLSAAIVSPLRTSREVRMITGGTDPVLASAGLSVVSVTPRETERAGSIFLYASDGDLGGSSSVPQSLNQRLDQVDSIEHSIETGVSLGLPLIADTMWGWLSFGLRSVEGFESRAAGAADSGFDEKSRALYVHIDSQWTPRYAASLALFHATRDDESASPIDGKASGLQLHESFVASPRIFIQGSGSIVTETIQPFTDGERWNLRADGSWAPAALPGHQFEAGIAGGESDIEPVRTGLDEKRVAFYGGDTLRFGPFTATASLRAESLRTANRSFRELLPRVGLVWRPGEGNTLVEGGYARYMWRPDPADGEPGTVGETFLALEREIATGFLLTSRLVDRNFDSSGNRSNWRGLELGARRRMSSGVYLDGQVSWMDSDAEEAIDARWAYSFSAIVRVPMAGIGAALSLHGRDGFSRPGGDRLSETWGLDLRISRELETSWPLQLSVDVLNVTNERVLLLEGDTPGGAPLVQQPRAVRLGVRASF